MGLGLGLGLGLGGVCAGTWDNSVPKRPARIRCRPVLQIGAPQLTLHVVSFFVFFFNSVLSSRRRGCKFSRRQGLRHPHERVLLDLPVCSFLCQFFLRLERNCELFLIYTAAMRDSTCTSFSLCLWAFFLPNVDLIHGGLFTKGLW